MSDGSKIEWLHTGGKKPSTWNPTTGCTKISPGCKNCYAKREWIRLSANPRQSIYYGRQFEDVAMHEERLAIPLLQSKARRYFVDSMSDLFHQDVRDSFIAAFFGVAAIASHHTMIALTKRADRMLDLVTALSGRIPHRWWMEEAFKLHGLSGYTARLVPERQWPLPNLQLGVSVESRAYLHRIDELRATPAAVRVISAEPLLEDLGDVDLSGIHQVYAGGESGPQARPSHADWFRSLRDQCQRQGVAFFFKQWGDWAPMDQVPMDAWTKTKTYTSVGGAAVWRFRKNAGRMLDGIEHSELVA